MLKWIRSVAIAMIFFLALIGFLVPPAVGYEDEEDFPQTTLFDNGNVYTVYNRPRGPTVFSLERSYVITKITTYHWNNARGANPGSISIRDMDGNSLGRWPVTTRPGQGNVPDAYWDAFPDLLLEPGTYTIHDSDPGTWSCNPENGDRGMAQVYGYHQRRHRGR